MNRKLTWQDRKNTEAVLRAFLDLPNTVRHGTTRSKRMHMLIEVLTMAWKVSGRSITMARSVNTSPVKHVYHLDPALKRGMNFSNSLPAGMLPCRISPET